MLGGERLAIANRVAKKLWHKYHDLTIEIEMSFHGQADLNNFPPIGKYRKTKVFCSNPYCCGNPRKIKGRKKATLTVQELRELERENIKEYRN